MVQISRRLTSYAILLLPAHAGLPISSVVLRTEPGDRFCVPRTTVRRFVPSAFTISIREPQQSPANTS